MPSFSVIISKFLADPNIKVVDSPTRGFYYANENAIANAWKKATGSSSYSHGTAQRSLVNHGFGLIRQPDGRLFRSIPSDPTYPHISLEKKLKKIHTQNINFLLMAAGEEIDDIKQKAKKVSKTKKIPKIAPKAKSSKLIELKKINLKIAKLIKKGKDLIKD